ncbi:hypothetical protein CLAIMM_08080, partial [Cladophialophora immunda]
MLGRAVIDICEDCATGSLTRLTAVRQCQVHNFQDRSFVSQQRVLIALRLASALPYYRRFAKCSLRSVRVSKGRFEEPTRALPEMTSTVPHEAHVGGLDFITPTWSRGMK